MDGLPDRLSFLNEEDFRAMQQQQNKNRKQKEKERKKSLYSYDVSLVFFVSHISYHLSHH